MCLTPVHHRPANGGGGCCSPSRLLLPLITAAPAAAAPDAAALHPYSSLLCRGGGSFPKLLDPELLGGPLALLPDPSLRCVLSLPPGNICGARRPPSAALLYQRSSQCNGEMQNSSGSSSDLYACMYVHVCMYFGSSSDQSASILSSAHPCSTMVTLPRCACIT